MSTLLTCVFMQEPLTKTTGNTTHIKLEFGAGNNRLGSAFIDLVPHSYVHGQNFLQPCLQPSPDREDCKMQCLADKDI